MKELMINTKQMNKLKWEDDGKFPTGENPKPFHIKDNLGMPETKQMNNKEKIIYEIIAEESHFDLKEEITKYINDGWELQGGVSSSRAFYLQAVTKKVSINTQNK